MEIGLESGRSDGTSVPRSGVRRTGGCLEVQTLGSDDPCSLSTCARRWLFCSGCVYVNVVRPTGAGLQSLVGEGRRDAVERMRPGTISEHLVAADGPSRSGCVDGWLLSRAGVVFGASRAVLEGGEGSRTGREAGKR